MRREVELEGDRVRAIIAIAVVKPAQTYWQRRVQRREREVE